MLAFVTCDSLRALGVPSRPGSAAPVLRSWVPDVPFGHHIGHFRASSDPPAERCRSPPVTSSLLTVLTITSTPRSRNLDPAAQGVTAPWWAGFGTVPIRHNLIRARMGRLLAPCHSICMHHGNQRNQWYGLIRCFGNGHAETSRGVGRLNPAMPPDNMVQPCCLDCLASLNLTRELWG